MHTKQMSETNIEQEYNTKADACFRSDRTFIANQQRMIEHREGGGMLQTTDDQESGENLLHNAAALSSFPSE